jgi:hypothetical protein
MFEPGTLSIMNMSSMRTLNEFLILLMPVEDIDALASRTIRKFRSRKGHRQFKAFENFGELNQVIQVHGFFSLSTRPLP